MACVKAKKQSSIVFSVVRLTQMFLLDSVIAIGLC